VSAVATAGSQLRYVNKAFWRNPASAFFIFAFPLMFLVIFTSLLGSGTVIVAGRAVHESTYYVAAMTAFAVVTASYNNLAIGLVFLRDSNVLKRIHGTPMPPAVYLAARIVHAVLVALLLVCITVAFGRLAYSADVPSGTALLRFLLVVVVGAVSFAALAFAIASVIPNFDAAAPIVNGTILPLFFLSGVFVPLGDHTPSWIVWTSQVFPVRPFARALQAGILGTTFHWTDVAVLAAWGVGGAAAALRWFSWQPRV